MTTTIDITENVTTVSASGTSTTIDITDDVTTVSAYSLAIPISVPGTLAASNIVTTPYGTLTANDLNTTLQQIADQDYRQDSAPSGSTLAQGDRWYDTDDDVLKVYVQTGGSSYEWQTLQSGTIAATEGGTGLTSIAKGSILAANSANTLTAVDGGGSTDKMLLYTASSDTISWTTDIDGGTY